MRIIFSKVLRFIWNLYHRFYFCWPQNTLICQFFQNKILLLCSYRQANVKGSRHPAPNRWIHILRSVCGSHHHHLSPQQAKRKYDCLFFFFFFLTKELKTCVVGEVSSPSHRLMNWAFIMAVASWSRLERFLRKDSKI